MVSIMAASDDLHVADGASAKSFTFPKCSFGTKGKNRAFSSAWFSKSSWLDYSEANDQVVCIYCSRANRRNLLLDGFRDVLRNICNKRFYQLEGCQ